MPIEELCVHWLTNLDTFPKKDKFICPLPTCRRPAFPSFRSITQHIRQSHATYDFTTWKMKDGVFQDGTPSIPCPKKCGLFFMTYIEAAHHRCTGERSMPFKCSYEEYVGCSQTFNHIKSLAMHEQRHRRDERAPFRCSKCDECHVSLYTLALHEDKYDRQKPTIDVTKTNPLTIQHLEGSTEPIDAVVTVRSSGKIPGSWFGKQANLHQGLEILRDNILVEFRSVSLLEANTQDATLLALGDCASRHVPALYPTNALDPLQPKLAWTFTTLLRKDLATITNNITLPKLPTLISLGWDGWTCEAWRLRLFLERVEEEGIYLLSRFSVNPVQ